MSGGSDQTVHQHSDGVRYVVQPGVGRNSVAALAMRLPVGHRSTPRTPLLAHLWEHLILGDAESGPIKAIEALGGFLNGFVDFESTVVFMVVPETALVDGVRALEESLVFPVDEPRYFKREKLAIVAELEEMICSDEVALGLAIRDSVWPGLGLGRELLKASRTAPKLSFDQVRRAFWQEFRPFSASVAVVGGGDEALRVPGELALRGLRQPAARSPHSGSGLAEGLLEPLEEQGGGGGGLRRLPSTRWAPLAAGSTLASLVFRLPSAGSYEVRTLVRLLDSLLVRDPSGFLRRLNRGDRGVEGICSTVIEGSDDSAYAIKFTAGSGVAGERCFETLASDLRNALDQAGPDEYRRAVRRTREATKRAFDDELRRALFLAHHADSGLHPGGLLRELARARREEVLDFGRRLLRGPALRVVAPQARVGKDRS